MGVKREKFYTVSARLVFSGIMVVLILALIVGVSIAINKGPITPLLGIGGSTVVHNSATSSNSTEHTTSSDGGPTIVEVTCAPYYLFGCLNPYFNYTTGILTVAISQKSGYNWTSVTVEFIPANTVYSGGVPIVSWSPPAAVNVTGGLLNDTVKYVNIPISSGPVGIGTNITGSIWAKYQLQVGEQVSYANMSTAFITVK
jgi:hypothetical protein